MVGVTLDAGALIGVERGSRRMQALLDEALSAGAELAVPAGVLGETWRGTARQARLARFLRLPHVTVVPLDDLGARAAGVLCGRAGTDDVIDSSVVICARLRGHAVITADPADLARLDPNLRLVQL